MRMDGCFSPATHIRMYFRMNAKYAMVREPPGHSFIITYSAWDSSCYI